MGQAHLKKFTALGLWLQSFKVLDVSNQAASVQNLCRVFGILGEASVMLQESLRCGGVQFLLHRESEIGPGPEELQVALLGQHLSNWSYLLVV